jgi:hypothetical protein
VLAELREAYDRGQWNAEALTAAVERATAKAAEEGT